MSHWFSLVSLLILSFLYHFFEFGWSICPAVEQCCVVPERFFICDKVMQQTNPKISIKIDIVFCAVVTIGGDAAECFNKFNDFAAGRELLSIMSKIFDAYVEDDPWWLIVGYLDSMCNVIPLKFRQHFVVSGAMHINRKDKETRLGRDNFPGGLLCYEVGYSGRRRRLIVVCSQWMMPGVSILNVLHCFRISQKAY